MTAPDADSGPVEAADAPAPHWTGEMATDMALADLEDEEFEGFAKFI